MCTQYTRNIHAMHTQYTRNIHARAHNVQHDKYIMYISKQISILVDLQCAAFYLLQQIECCTLCACACMFNRMHVCTYIHQSCRSTYILTCLQMQQRECNTTKRTQQRCMLHNLLCIMLLQKTQKKKTQVVQHFLQQHVVER